MSVEAAAWAGKILAARGEREVGTPEIVRSYPWSTVERLPTSSGAVYLKRVASPFAVELALLPLLSQWFPESVPAILAVDAGGRRLLMADAGMPLRTRLKKSFDAAPLGNALALCARIQRAAAGRTAELLSIGLADWRLGRLLDLYRELVDRTQGLAAEERAALRAHAPRFEALCAELAACGIPETLEHCDFHDNNVLVRDDRMVIADWGDAVIAHPFFSLASCIESAIWHHALDAVAIETLTEAYLASWRDVGTPIGRRDAVRLARRLRPVTLAMNLDRIAAIEGAGDTFADMPATELRRFLRGSV